MRFSSSMMKRWMNCPKQAHFHDVMRQPEPQNSKTVFGTCVHKALEEFNQHGNAELAINRFIDIWANPSLIGEEIDVWSKWSSYGELREKGREIIRQYSETNKWEKRRIIGTEIEFLVPMGDHYISGYIDCLEVKKGKNGDFLEICDYKTSSKQPTKLELRMNIQFTAYIYATLQPEFWQDIPDGPELYDKLEGIERRGLWYHLWTMKQLDVGTRDDMDFMRLYRIMTEIEKAIEHDVYVPAVNAESCVFCSYVDVCPAVIPIKEDVLEIRSN